MFLTAIAMGAGWWVAYPLESIYMRFVVKVLVAVIVYLLILWQSGSVAFRERVEFLLGKMNRSR